MNREEAIHILNNLKPTNTTSSFDAYVVGNAITMAIKALEQEPIEVEATKLQMAYNQGFEDCRKAVMDLLNEAGKLSLLAMVADLQSVNPQEPKIGHWTHDGSHWKNRFICSKCGYKLFDEQTNFCPNCGAKMESETKNE